MKAIQACQQCRHENTTPIIGSEGPYSNLNESLGVGSENAVETSLPAHSYAHPRCIYHDLSLTC